MAENQNKPSNLIKKGIHTTLSDILDFGSDTLTLAAPKNRVNETQERLKKLVAQLQDLNNRIDRLLQS